MEGRLAILLDLNTSYQLGEEDEIENDRGGEEGVFAGVMDDEGVLATEENLRGVLIHGTLAVPDVRHVLDDDAVIRVLARAIQDRIGPHHVVYDVGFRDLLGTEGLRGGEIAAVVVSEMVVADNGDGLETGTNEEIDEDGLELGLTRLEVITTDNDVVLHGKIYKTRDKGVLGGTVDKGDTLENRGDTIEGRGGNLGLIALNGRKEVFGAIIKTGDNLGETLSVGGPEDNNLVDTRGSFEAANLLTDSLDLVLLGTLDDVISTLFLIGSNEVSIVDTGHRKQILHIRNELLLKIPVKNLSTLHGLGQVKVGDIPTANDNIIGVNERKKAIEGNINLLTLIIANAESGSLGKRTVKVGLLKTLLGHPCDAMLVGEQTSRKSRSIVATPTNQEDTEKLLKFNRWLR